MSYAPSGIPVVHELQWGSHFCQFYETRADLAESLVPFFKAGLDNGERCLWITSEPFPSDDARSALRTAVPDLDRRERSGQIDILDFDQWYVRNGKLSPDETVRDWLTRANEAISDGYAGLRLTGNTFWLECEAFDEFAEYEATVNRHFTSQPIIALCSYCLGRCRPSDVLEVVRNHQFAVSRRRGAWEVVEDASLKIARAELERLNSHLDRLVSERTTELENALRERTELFHEVHHRVRNNLAVLASLLRMKLRQATAAETRSTFVDMLGRIDAIGLVHEALYSSGELSRVPLSHYLEKLCDAVVQLRRDQTRARLVLSVDDAHVPLPQAVPLGLIVNELVTNALKHAFPDGREGVVSVTFRSDGTQCELHIRDNGIGLPPGAVEEKPRSGLQLVRALVQQLNGTLREETNEGVSVRLDFPATSALA